MVFSPAPHWLLCAEPSFDINWVKHEGGREGGQQLDPTVNVTLVSQLHRCQSLAFRFISLFCLCVPLISVCVLRTLLRHVYCILLTSSMCVCRQTTHACWWQTDELLKVNEMHPTKHLLGENVLKNLWIVVFISIMHIKVKKTVQLCP